MRDKVGDYDEFYLGALSHPPTLCCKKPKLCKEVASSSLSVHGLWPSRVAGHNPMNCAVPSAMESASAPRPLSRREAHEWRKHGSCSGLTQDYYFLEERRLGMSEPVRHLRTVLDRGRAAGALHVDMEELVRLPPGTSKSSSSSSSSLAVKTSQDCRLEEITLCLSKAADGSFGRLIPCPTRLLSGARNSGRSHYKCTKVFIGSSCSALTPAMVELLKEKEKVKVKVEVKNMMS
jgi:ribonuclease I